MTELDTPTISQVPSLSGTTTNSPPSMSTSPSTPIPIKQEHEPQVKVDVHELTDELKEEGEHDPEVRSFSSLGHCFD